MYFRIRYLIRDFELGETQVDLPDADKKIRVVIKTALPTETAMELKKGDGIAIISCEREVSERIQKDAISSGQLSLKQEPIGKIFADMGGYLLRAIRLIRWRTNSKGGPNPIKSVLPDGLQWSLDGTDWKRVSGFFSLKITQLDPPPEWTPEVAEFVMGELSGELDEPLGHELLREAWILRDVSPRSAIVMGVAAAEIGFKQFAMVKFPDSAWVLENLPSPPLLKMLSDFFPWDKLKLQINGKNLTVPESTMANLKKAVTLRNEVVHKGTQSMDADTVDSVLTAVRDLLYFLDALNGPRNWCFAYLSQDARGQFA
jgi:hypothetical protein